MTAARRRLENRRALKIMNEKDKLRSILETAFERLAKEPHPTIAGLRRRYYYRGRFTLMEHLSPKALAWNVKRLSRREPDHAARLSEVVAAQPGRAR